jgi:hypothetical protein
MTLKRHDGTIFRYRYRASWPAVERAADRKGWRAVAVCGCVMFYHDVYFGAICTRSDHVATWGPIAGVLSTNEPPKIGRERTR